MGLATHNTCTCSLDGLYYIRQLVATFSCGEWWRKSIPSLYNLFWCKILILDGAESFPDNIFPYRFEFLFSFMVRKKNTEKLTTPSRTFRVFFFFFQFFPVYFATFFQVQKRTLFAPSVCGIIFELPRTSVESYARSHLKTSISIFRIIRRPRVPRTSKYDTRYRYHVPGIYT